MITAVTGIVNSPSHFKLGSRLIYHRSIGKLIVVLRSSIIGAHEATHFANVAVRNSDGEIVQSKVHHHSQLEDAHCDVIGDHQRQFSSRWSIAIEGIPKWSSGEDNCGVQWGYLDNSFLDTGWSATTRAPVAGDADDREGVICAVFGEDMGAVVKEIVKQSVIGAVVWVAHSSSRG